MRPHTQGTYGSQPSCRCDAHPQPDAPAGGECALWGWAVSEVLGFPHPPPQVVDFPLFRGRASALLGGAVTQHYYAPAPQPCLLTPSALTTAALPLATSTSAPRSHSVVTWSGRRGLAWASVTSGRAGKSLPRVPGGPRLRVCRDWQEQTHVETLTCWGSHDSAPDFGATLACRSEEVSPNPQAQTHSQCFHLLLKSRSRSQSQSSGTGTAVPASALPMALF